MADEPMLIVLDTNVLVSALLKRKSKPGVILDLILSEDLRVVLDQRILAEYRSVLARPRFDILSEDIDNIIQYLSLTSLRVAIAEPLVDAGEWIDKGDIPFAEVAIAAGACAIVTGNVRHYANLTNQGFLVLTPSEFVERR